MPLSQEFEISIANIKDSYVIDVEIARQEDNNEAPWYLTYQNLFQAKSLLSFVNGLPLVVAAQWELCTTISSPALGLIGSPPRTRSVVRGDGDLAIFLELDTGMYYDTSGDEAMDTSIESVTFDNKPLDITRRYPDFTGFVLIDNGRNIQPLFNVEIKAPYSSLETGEMVKSDAGISKDLPIFDRTGEQVVSQAKHAFSAYPLEKYPTFRKLYAFTIIGTLFSVSTFERSEVMPPKKTFESKVFNVFKYANSDINAKGEVNFSKFDYYWGEMLGISDPMVDQENI
ncbi:hypothetical protein BDZ94DRAFT_1302279 [Collybia nuda]|uniref:Uncharacterized protein n=1 Tax=Collybia nuda TaxID=64659 RepID=A0A9P5XSN3_9AGAR|nr:hypothetical protein BDZ94DRAFT_1302279 [Collybia nuda]